jgi:two-component system sensor histidine kinase HydH
LSRLAHEIRNPLSSLDIHVQLLEEDLARTAPHLNLNEKNAARFEIIRGELHRLETIVKQFLSLAGPSSLELQPVDIGRIIGHVADLLRPEAGSRGIQIAAEIPDPSPPLTADSVQLTQALVNLVINAIQAVGADGRVDLGVETDAANGFLSIAVRDSGPGIPPGKLASVFDPYFTTRPEGSGLGLWIVQQIVTAHGGDVSAANAPGGGAVFTVRLPLGGETHANG